MPGSRQVRACLDAVIDALKREGVWNVAEPPPAAFADMGAFGTRSMAFSQWLRFVFVPNVEALIAANGPWPAQSQTAVMAAREGDTDAAIAALVEPLSRFDALFGDRDDEPGPGATAVDTAAAAAAYQRSRTLLRGKDYAGALAAAREAIASDPAYPNAENFAGWVLMSNPGRTPADVEAAVEHFGNAPGGTALSNLGDALLALGRADDALARLERAPETPEVRNWLGWYFTDKRPDLPRAITELEEATRLRPAWGVAWLNLAKALDASADVVEACRAYGQAISCGDAHQDPFARDRRVQLELALRTRGQKPPDAPLTARADSAAVGIVLAAAAYPELATGQAFMIRPTASVRAGEVAFAGIATVAGGRALGHAVVRDLGHERVASVLMREDPLVFRTLPADDPEDAAALLSDWLLDGGADPAAVTPLDASVYLFDLFARDLPRPWRLSIDADRPASVSVTEIDAGVSVGVRARPGGGICVALFPDAAGTRSSELEIETPARMLELAPAIVEAARVALASAIIPDG